MPVKKSTFNVFCFLFVLILIFAVSSCMEASSVTSRSYGLKPKIICLG